MSSASTACGTYLTFCGETPARNRASLVKVDGVQTVTSCFFMTSCQLSGMA